MEEKESDGEEDEKAKAEDEEPERGVLGGSWRYIAGELYTGSYRSRGPERTVLGGSWI